MRSEQSVIDAMRALVTEPAEPIDDGTAFVAAVTRRTGNQPTPRVVRLRRRLVQALAVVVVTISSIVPGPRTAFARWLGIGSVRLERSPNVSGELPADVRDLDLGTASTVTAASAHLGRAMVSPELKPVGIWAQGSAVNAVYLVDGASVLVSELPGPGSIYASKKLLGGATRMDFFTLRNEGAVWISGAPHEVALQTPSGSIAIVPVRLAGDVLLWADSNRTIRIEGFTDRATAVAFFETLRFPA